MVAAVAFVEPQMAAKPAQAPTVAMASPPGQCPINLYAVSKSLRDMPVWNAICPISTNRGITVRLYELNTATRSLARRVDAASTFTIEAKPINPTIAMRKPMGILVKMRTTSATRPMIPIVVGLISS